MAKTFYGYVEKDMTKFPDWADITKDISDDLNKVSESRQLERQVIAENTVKATDALKTFTNGSDPTTNQFIQNGSDASVAYLNEQNRKLRNREISPAEYKLAMQGQLDDWKGLTKVTNEWNVKYEEYLLRTKNDDSSKLEQDTAMLIEGFGNTSNKSLIVNPIDGRLYVASYNEDGSVNTDAQSMSSISDISNILNTKYDRFKVVEEVQAQVDLLGDVMLVVDKELIAQGVSPKVATLEDITKTEAYKKAEDSAVKGILESEINRASVLVDYLNYDVTYDANNTDPGKVLMVKNKTTGSYVPVLTDEQNELAEETVREQMRAQLDYKESLKPPPPARPVDNDRRDKLNTQKEALNSVAQLWSGSESQKQEAADFLRSMNSNISRIDVNASGVNIVYEDGNQESMPFEGMNGNDWVTGNTNFFLSSGYKIPNVTDVARRTVGNISGSATNFEASSYGTSVTRVDNTEKIDELTDEIDKMMKIANADPESMRIQQNIDTFNNAVKERDRLREEQGLQKISTPQYVGGGGMGGF